MKRFSWLLVAVALLGLAAFLMSRGDKPKRTQREAEVDFPRSARSEERVRNERRRTLPPARSKGDSPRADELYKRDPLIVALPTDKKKARLFSRLRDCGIRRWAKRGSIV